MLVHGHPRGSSRSVDASPLKPTVSRQIAVSFTVRTPDVAPQFKTGGENGLSHSFRWRELRGWGRWCSPALDPVPAAGLIRRGPAGEHRLPHVRPHCRFHDIRVLTVRHGSEALPPILPAPTEYSPRVVRTRVPLVMIMCLRAWRLESPPLRTSSVRAGSGISDIPGVRYQKILPSLTLRTTYCYSHHAQTSLRRISNTGKSYFFPQQPHRKGHGKRHSMPLRYVPKELGISAFSYPLPNAPVSRETVRPVRKNR
jgi:hypothetical protein